MQPPLCRAFVVPYSSQPRLGTAPPSALRERGCREVRGHGASGEVAGRDTEKSGGHCGLPCAPLQGSVRCSLPLLPTKGLSRSRGWFLHVLPQVCVGGNWHHMGRIKPHAPSLQGCSVGWGLLVYRDRLYSGFLYRVPSIGLLYRAYSLAC